MRTSGLVLLASLLCGTGSAFADWKLDNNQSRLHFISTKNEHVSEVHQFKKLEGQLGETGNLNIQVDLASVDTGIAIRDDRMKKHLFNLVELPSATLTATLPKALMSLKEGQSRTFDLDTTLMINGVSLPQKMEVQVSKLANDSLLATTTKPVLINAAGVKLQGGVGVLQKMAGLSSISLTVPLTFSVVFVAQ